MVNGKHKKVDEKCGPPEKLTREKILEQIDTDNYRTFEGTTVTVCLLTLKNGFHVVGHSACLSMEYFDAQVGRQIAFDDAVEKIWQLEGYRIKSEMQHAKC